MPYQDADCSRLLTNGEGDCQVTSTSFAKDSSARRSRVAIRIPTSTNAIHAEMTIGCFFKSLAPDKVIDLERVISGIAQDVLSKAAAVCMRM